MMMMMMMMVVVLDATVWTPDEVDDEDHSVGVDDGACPRRVDAAR
jgi:hypothetical protein